MANLCAYGKAQRVLWRNASYIIFGGNSYACAHATGIILKAQKEKPRWNIEDIIKGICQGRLEFDTNTPCNKKLSRSQYKKDLNKVMHELDLLNRDIILTGCQSNTIFSEINNIKDLTFPQLSFLYGTQPDGIILCVSGFDDKQYIKRTISCLESLISCKVIAVVLFPLSFSSMMTGIYRKKRRLDAKELNFTCNNLESEIDLPVYVLGDNAHMEQLLDKVIEFYS